MIEKHKIDKIAAVPSIIDLRVDGLPSGALAVASREPVFSWRYAGVAPTFRQTAWRIVARDEEQNILWDSQWQKGRNSFGIPWGGSTLESRVRIYWQVSARGNDAEEMTSETVAFETPLFDNTDWKGVWISYSRNNPDAEAPIPHFRKSFQLTSQPCRARLYVAARGIAIASINGKRVGQDHLAPGWTDYAKQIQYLTYDVTDFLQQGKNILGVRLGDGWYCGLFSGRRRNIFGSPAEVMMQLEITDDTGSQSIVTDGSWRCASGPTLRSSIYDGEEYDARKELPLWDRPEYDDANWLFAAAGTDALSSPPLVPKCCLPVRPVQELQPVAVLHPDPEITIFDFGQNLAGTVRLSVIAPRGRAFTLRFAEMLNANGTLYTANYRSARSTDYYYAAGDPEGDIWEPEFTYHGFRYVQVDGQQSGNVEKLELTAIVLQSDMEAAGTFNCGHAKLNRLYQNVIWGQKSNFVEIPTDCPQRDERLGWTGDAQIFCGTAARNMNVQAFFHKYMRDVRDARRSDGGVANIAPDVLRRTYDGAGWGDAAVIIPWTIYQRYGDIKILKDNYAMMCGWVDFQYRDTTNGIRNKASYGDWLAPVPTPVEVVATAYLSYTARLLSRIAGLLKKEADVQKYAAIAETEARAFCQNFVNADGSTNPDTQTCCILALHFDLVPADLRPKVAANLRRLVRENGNRLSTGFVGTAYLNLTLAEMDMNDCACDLWLQEEYPSWLFSVNQGATTMWERWNSYTVKDGFGDASMNSFNHYAYGAVHEWVVDYMGGIRYLTPAGTHLLFAPRPDERIGHLEVTLQTPAGPARSAWRFENDVLHWEITSPPNTDVTIQLPENWKTAENYQDFSGGDLALTLHRS